MKSETKRIHSWLWQQSKTPLHVLTVASAFLILVGCLECLPSPFTFALSINGNFYIGDDVTVQAPASIRMGASSQFIQPTCRDFVSTNKVAFYWGSQLLAVITRDPTNPQGSFEYTWNVQPGKDGVPTSGSLTQDFYAVANDTYTNGKIKLTIQVTTANRASQPPVIAVKPTSVQFGSLPRASCGKT